MSNQPSSRREFIRTIVLSTASLVVLPAVARAADSSAPGSDAPVFVDLGAKSQYKGDWTRVVLPAKFNQEVVFVRPTPADVAKANPSAGLYQAVSARCTHRGCVIAYFPDQKDFVCPCHHGTFDDNGVNISGPPQHPLWSLQTQVSKDNHLLVQAPPAILTESFGHHHRD